MQWIFWGKLNSPGWARRVLGRRLEASVHFQALLLTRFVTSGEPLAIPRLSFPTCTKRVAVTLQSAHEDKL